MLHELDNRLTSLPTNEVTDEELMTKIRSRDEVALKTLMHRHTPLLRTAIGHVVRTHDFDDVFQEVLVQVWNSAGRFDKSRGKVLGWIITMARRRAIDFGRRLQSLARAEESLRLTTAHESQLSLFPSPDEDAQNSERAKIFRQILSTLPANQSSALKLSFYTGLSHREIAAKTGTPLGTIKTRLELALNKVKAAVLHRGGRSEWSLCPA